MIENQNKESSNVISKVKISKLFCQPDNTIQLNLFLIISKTIKYFHFKFLNFIYLQVEKNADPTTLHRTPDPSTFPAAPGTPKIVNITESSVALIWGKGPERAGSSPLIGYTIEYFSSDLQTGWVVAAHRVPAQTITVSSKQSIKLNC